MSDLGTLREGGNLRFRYSDDPAWMVIADTGRFEPNQPDWTYESITASVVEAMSAGSVVAWGVPEANLNVLLTVKRPSIDAKATTVSNLHCDDTLQVASYTAVTMAAQFDDSTLAEEAEFTFSITPGDYNVEVMRTFDHQAGAQSPDEPLSKTEDHYIVVFTPGTQADLEIQSVPWALQTL